MNTEATVKEMLVQSVEAMWDRSYGNADFVGGATWQLRRTTKLGGYKITAIAPHTGESVTYKLAVDVSPPAVGDKVAVSIS